MIPLLLAATTLAAAHASVPINKSQKPIKRESFGKTPEGQSIELYTLTNNNGMHASIATLGATLVRLITPDRNGKFEDVVLGYDTLDSYLDDSHHFGGIIGRFANRIAQARFILDGKAYQLAHNNGANSLHGGLKGFDKHVWVAEILKSEYPSVRFTRTSPDNEEGFPGKLDVTVIYTLTDKNEFIISYQATTDQTTVINLTNHAYFNLTGAGNGTILSHELKIYADSFTPVDQQLIPTGETKTVAGTALDFRKATAVGARIQEIGKNSAGYDHNYVLSKNSAQGPALAAELRDPSSSRWMKVYTTEPGIQFYSGNFLDGTTIGKNGKIYQRYCGLCLETQHFPDSPNHSNFPSTVLRPGETYKTETIYQFGANR